MKNNELFLNHFKSLQLEIIYEENNPVYKHVGAFLIDSSLQAGLNYKYVVYPRVRIVLEKYKTFSTVNKFYELINMVGIETITNINNKQKNNLIISLIYLFMDNDIDTTEDIKNWMSIEKNIKTLLNLKGIGPKTLDYMKKLIGIDAIPIDRHMINFINEAGIKETKYNVIQNIFSKASNQLGLKLSSMDKTIWNYMTKK